MTEISKTLDLSSLLTEMIQINLLRAVIQCAQRDHEETIKNVGMISAAAGTER